MFLCLCVRAGESVGFVGRCLATFMSAYGPWVWDRVGACTRARPVLVGGGSMRAGWQLEYDLDLINY